MQNTRLDLTYVLSIGSLFMHKLGKQHMSAIIYILLYLNYAIGNGILFQNKIQIVKV